MKITIVGGTGHIGTYLVPRLVELGHEVTCVTRGRREPYLPHAAWAGVRKVSLDREALEARAASPPRSPAWSRTRSST